MVWLEVTHAVMGGGKSDLQEKETNYNQQGEINGLL